MDPMTTSSRALVVSIVIVGGISSGLLMACGESKTIPKTMVGSYVRTEPSMVGVLVTTASLELREVGMAMRAPSSSATSVVFKRVGCKGDTCTFVSDDDRCDGTISRDDAGDLTISARGLCGSALTGKWLGARSASSAIPSGPIYH